METIDLTILAKHIYESVESYYLLQRFPVYRVHRFAPKKQHHNQRTPRNNCATLIGEEIRRRRLHLEMTQEKLAQMIHIDTAQVSRHEHGRQLTLNILPLYAEALGCSVQALLPGHSTERVFSTLNDHLERIYDLFPEILELPPEQREQVLNIVETTLKLALKK